MNSRGGDGGEIRKVAVAFDPACGSPDLLHAASELAASLGADLEALFIDDQDISRLSRLPFGRIVEPLSGKSEIFDDAAVRSRRAGPLARSRAILRDLSRRHRLAFSVRELPGMALADAASSSTAELIVVASFHLKFGGGRTIDRDAWEIAAQSAGSVLLVSHLPVSVRKIVVVSDDSPAGQRAVAVAARLVRRGAPAETPPIGHLHPQGQTAQALAGKVLALAPTLVIVGLRDAALTAAIQEVSVTETFSVLTVR